MGEAGRAFASAHFRVETMVEQIDAVYARLLGLNPSRPVWDDVSSSPCPRT